MEIEPLLPHQEDCIHMMHDRWFEGGWILIQHQMRSRKTSTILSFLEQRLCMGDRMDRVLVVCPPKVIPVWDEWKARYRVGEGVTVMSSGALSSKNTRIEAEWDVVVVDELHQYRDYSARMRALKKLCSEAHFRIGMTGTMVDKCSEELFYPLTILSAGDFFNTWSRTAFRTYFCEKEDPHYDHSPWRVKPEMEREMYGELKSCMHTYNGEGSINPPEHVKVVYPLGDRQERWVRDLVDRDPIQEMVKDGNGHLQAQLKPAHIPSKRHQIESGFWLEDKRALYEFESDKWQCLADILRKEKGRVLVWYRFILEKRLIGDAFDEGMVEFSPKNLKRFRDGEVRIMVVHPRAAGAGIDFSCADASVFVTPNPSNTDMMQSFYRLSMMGGEKKKRCYHLVSEWWGDVDYENMMGKMETVYGLYKQGRKHE